VSDEDVFAGYVAQCHSNMESVRSDLEQLYAYYGVQSEGGFYATSVIADHLRTRIPDLLSARVGWTRSDLKRLEHQLILKHVVEDAPLFPAFQYIDVITDALGDRTVAELAADKPAWRDAVQAAHDYILLGTGAYGSSPSQVHALHNRSWNVGRAARALRDRGSPARIVSGEVHLTEAQSATVARRIRAAIRRHGAFGVIERVFSALEPSFDKEQERYHITRSVAQLPKIREASVPIGYILNLCVRELAPRRSVPSRAVADAAWREIVELSTALVATYDVEPYTIYEGLFQNAATLPRFLQNIAVFDAAFTVPQLRPSDVPRFLRGVFAWVDDAAFTARHGWSLENAIALAEVVLEKGRQVRGPVLLEFADLARALPTLGARALPEILAALGHVRHPNAAYELPTDGAKLDFGFRPLLPWVGDSSLLLDASWCAPAFFEGIAALLRADFKGTDDAIGLAAERFVRSELERHGVHGLAGEYVVDGEDGECDIVVESTRNIVFIEMKKKALTRLARSGSDLEVLVDLSKSLLTAQAQAGWHELRLREKGCLELKGEAGSVELQLGGRDIERVALTLLDYGALQDRVVMDRILRVVVGAKVTASNPSLQGKLDALAASQVELLEQYQVLSAHDAGRKDQPFFNCWFLSVPQLLVTLDHVKSAEEFVRALWDTRHITFGTGDYYFELASSRKMRAAGP
jgi:Holliday junction resolvase-like predicted endonuclease